MKFFNNKKTAFLIIAVLALSVLSGLFSVANAAFNQQINYQGKLRKVSNNTIVSNDDYNIEFSLYTAASGGTPIWTETRETTNMVTVTDGLFSVLLGEISSLDEVDFSQTLYLGVKIGSTTTPAVWDDEMTPRKKFGMTPASSVAGKVTGSARSSVGTTSPATNTSLTVEATSTNSVAMAIRGYVGQLVDLLRIFTGEGEQVLTVSNDGKLGVGTTSPYAKLSVVGETVSSYFTATSTTATSTLTNLSVSQNSILGTIIGGVWEGTVIGDSFLTKSGAWTGTFDGLEGTDYIAGSFSTTSANAWSSLGLGFSTTSANAWSADKGYITTAGETDPVWSGDKANYLLTANAWATTSSDAWSALGYGFSTTSSDHWLTQNRGNAFSTTSTDYWKTQNNFFSTTSADAWSTLGYGFSTTSADHWMSLNGGSSFSTTSADYWSTEGLGFSTTSAIYFVNASTTIPKTYTANTFTELQTFNANATTTGLTVTDSTYLATAGGNVGIGTTTPSAKFVLDGGTAWFLRSNKGLFINPNYQLLDTHALISSGISGQTSNMDLRLQAGNDDSTNGITIKSDGNVGLGTTTPMQKLSVIGASNTADVGIEIGGYNADVSRRWNIVRKGYNATKNKYDLEITTPDYAGDFLINNTGNVGIGTTTLRSALDVTGANTVTNGYGQLYVHSNDAAGIDLGGQIALGGYYSATGLDGAWTTIAGRKENSTDNNYSGYLAFATAANGGAVTEKMRVTSAGNVGIGTTTSSSKLAVYNSGTGNNVILNGANNYAGIQFNVANVYKGQIMQEATGNMYFDSAADLLLRPTGDLGIGTGTPSTKFSVGGAAGDATGHGYFTGGLGVGLVNEAAGTLKTSGAATIVGTLTANGTLDANGAATIGDGGDNVTIDSSVWDISSAGAISGVTTISTNNTLTISPASAGPWAITFSRTDLSAPVSIYQSADNVLTFGTGDILDVDYASTTAVTVDGLLDINGSWTIGATAVTATAAELNIMDGVTATAAEINLNDTQTATAAEVNILDGATLTVTELNVLDGIAAGLTAAELSILDGVTATAAEINLNDGQTATAAEVNILDGVTGVTAAELSYVGDVTSAIQAQFTAKAPLASPTFTGTVTLTYASTTSVTVGGLLDINGTLMLGTTAITATGAELNIMDGVTATAAELNLNDGQTATAAEVNILDGVTGVTAAELSYVGDVTSAIQAQFTAKAPLASPTFTGTVTLTYASTTALTASGSLFVGDGDTRLLKGSNDVLRVQTPSGYIDIGAQNTSYAHIYTDRANFYFDKGVYAGNANSYLNTSAGNSYISAVGDLSVGTTTSATETLSVSGGNVTIGNADYESYDLQFRTRADEGIVEASYSLSMMAPESLFFHIDSNANGTANFFSVVHDQSTGGSNTSELFRVQENGNVGIGTTTPMGMLGINSGATPAESQIFIQANSAGGISTLAYAADNSYINFDMYYHGGAWKSLDAGSNFEIRKNGDVLSLNYDSGVAIGSTPTMNLGLTLSTAGLVTIPGAETVTGTVTSNGTFDANGVVALGDGGDDISIDSNDWDISSAGVASGFTGITSTVFSTGAAPASAGALRFSNAESIQYRNSGNTVDLNLLNWTSGNVVTMGDANTGSINFTNAGGANYFLFNTGKVGIGTTTPVSTLSVQGSLCVRNTGSCGTTAGTIYATTATITDIDLAENYRVADSTIEAGEIVSIDISQTETVKRAEKDDDVVVGIISTAPGLLLGNEIPGGKPVALSGRVPVKVNLENGPIAIGDRISISSTAGVGMKMSSASSQSIGVALESYNGEPSKNGKIVAFVNLSWNKLDDSIADSKVNSNLWLTDDAGRIKLVTAGALDMQAKDIVNVGKLLSASGKWSMSEEGVLVVEEVRARKVGTKEFCIDDICIGRDDFKALLLTAGISKTTPTTTEDNASTTTPPSDTADIDADTTAPVITLNGSANITFTITIPATGYADSGATVTDNVNNNLGVQASVWKLAPQDAGGRTKLSDTAEITDTSAPATYEIHYNATDQAGNKATEVIRTVTYIAPEPIVIVPPTVTASSTDETATTTEEIE